MCQLLLRLSSSQVGRRLTTGDRNSEANEGMCGTDDYGIRHSFLPSKNPTTANQRYITAPVDTSSQEVCTTLPVNCTFKYKHSSVYQLPFINCVYIFIQEHNSKRDYLPSSCHDNGPTYNTNAVKTLLLQQITPNIL
jgi:hypothetical protein